MNANQTGDSPQAWVSHLDDLRGALLRSLGYCVVAFSVCFWKSAWIFETLVGPLKAAGATGANPSIGLLQTLDPSEVFFTDIRLSALAAVLVASPFLLREAWVFVSPGLKAGERRALLPALIAGLGFFTSGVLFAYYLVVPATLRFFIDYNLKLQAVPQWTLGAYMNFITTLLLAFGLTFELPLVLAVCSAMGLVTPAFLRHKRRQAILGIAVLAAVVTPTVDPFTQLAMALPLVFLYEAGIWMSYATSPRPKP